VEGRAAPRATTLTVHVEYDAFFLDTCSVDSKHLAELLIFLLELRDLALALRYPVFWCSGRRCVVGQDLYQLVQVQGLGTGGFGVFPNQGTIEGTETKCEALEAVGGVVLVGKRCVLALRIASEE